MEGHRGRQGGGDVPGRAVAHGNGRFVAVGSSPMAEPNEVDRVLGVLREDWQETGRRHFAPPRSGDRAGRR